jgi:hypothetical protein
VSLSSATSGRNALAGASLPIEHGIFLLHAERDFDQMTGAIAELQVD